MKNLISRIIFLILIFSFSTTGFGNSGPVFWQGYPSSDIMSIEDDSPITVKNENLVFDFSDSDDSSYTIGGKITATYKMVNPTNEVKSVQMAFPFVGTIKSFLSDDVVITADDVVLPYDIYIGNQGDKEVNFDFANIVNTITDELYMAKNFEKNENGKLYLIEVKPTTDQRINFAIDFNFNYEKTKVITTGFNRYERDDEKTRIAAWCYKPEILKIFVLGEDIELNISAYTDGELKEKTDLFNYQIVTEEVEFKPYLVDFIKNNDEVKNDYIIADTQLYNLYAKYLDEYFTINMGYCSEDDLMALENYKRILTFIYTVEFPQNSEKEVSVSYKTSGTMDMTETSKPLYSFDYILNPAENWRDFKNLNIKIVTPQEAPYIVKSNIELIKKENNVYIGNLSELPDDDLSFTLYEDEKITLFNRVEGNLYNRFRYFTPFVIGGVALLIIGVIIVGVFLKKKRD